MAVRGVVGGDLVRRRIERAFVLILVCYLSLIGRLVYLQGGQGATLRAEAIEKRTQPIPLHARRGSLYDRDGKPLAASLYAGTVCFDPSKAQPTPDNAKKTAKMRTDLDRSVKQIATLLHLPEAQIRQQVEQAQGLYAAQVAAGVKKPVRYVPLLKGVPLETAQQIRDARPRLLGFGVDDDSKRVYSSGPNAAQVVGYLGPDGVGVSGLEWTCRKWLNGRDGKAYTEVDPQSREIPGTLQRLLPARDGLDVYTTLDANAQHIATEEAQKIWDAYHPLGISVVILDPVTGDIRALVSLPNFDPNPGQRDTLAGEGLAERCLCRYYEPGSTLKSLTVAAALDAGVITPQSTFYCKGTIKVGRGLIHCVLHGASERYGHGVETPEEILRHSCNIGAAQIGLKMGPELLFDAEREFGLLTKLNLGLRTEQWGHLSLDPNEKINSPGKVARVAFGHSITTTPLHVALAYAALANDGVLMKPRLLTEIRDASGKPLQSWQPQQAHRVITRKTADLVRSMLRAVIANGTGKVAAIPGYQVAGKTGTARKYKARAWVGSFVGFLPAGSQSTPRAVILVAVDEPKGSYYGAEVAAPAFQAIARRLMAAWHVPEDDPNATQAHTAAENLRRTGHVTTPLAKRDLD